MGGSMKKVVALAIVAFAANIYATTNTVYIDTYSKEPFEVQLAPEIGTTNTIQFKMYSNRTYIGVGTYTPFIYASRSSSVSGGDVIEIKGTASGNTATFTTADFDVGQGYDGWKLSLVFRAGSTPATYTYVYPCDGVLKVTSTPITVTGDPTLIAKKSSITFENFSAYGNATVDGSITATELGSIDYQTFDPTKYTATNSGLDLEALTIIDGSSADVILTDMSLYAYTMFVITCSDSSNTTSVQLSSGSTFDGTNSKATFDAAGETLICYAISSTQAVIISNVGSVSMSAP